MIFIMQISPSSYYLLPLKPKHLPHQPVLEHPQPMFFP
jgi:hypothetical protein